jgi:hypothetical protein
MAGEVVCDDGNWQISGTCVNEAETETVETSATEFSFILDDINGEIDLTWARRHIDVFVAALADALGVNTSQILLEIKHMVPEPLVRRLLSADGQHSPNAFVVQAIVTAAASEVNPTIDFRQSLLDEIQTQGLLPRTALSQSSFSVSTPEVKHLDVVTLPVATWLVGDWGVCSATCGAGVTTRVASCFSSLSSECEQTAGQHPILSEACEEQQCPIPPTVMCPLGSSTIPCALQTSVLLVAVLLIFGIPCGCSIRSFRRKLKPPSEGSVYIQTLDSAVAFNVVRPKNKVDNSRPTLLASEGSPKQSMSLSPNSALTRDGKTHVIWDTDVPKVQAWFEAAEDQVLESADVDLELGEANQVSDEGFTPKNSMVPSESALSDMSAGGRTPKNIAVVVRQHQLDNFNRGPHAPYLDGASIEYYSFTQQRWMAGVIKLQSQGRATSEELHLHVELSRGNQLRADVTLDNIRLALEPNDLVEVLVEEKDDEGEHSHKYHPAFVTANQSKAATMLGYHVHMETTGRVLKNVPAVRLRRRFPAGARVEIFRGPSLGWCEGRIHGDVGSSDGCGNEGFSPLPEVQELQKTPLPVAEEDLCDRDGSEALDVAVATGASLGLWTYVPICTETESFEQVPSYLVRAAKIT